MLNIKHYTIVVLIFISVLSVIFLSGCGEGLNILTYDGSDNTCWNLYDYKRMITIKDNSGTALSDYQVNIVLENDPSLYIRSAADGNDIRFRCNDISLPYWIEAWDSGATRKFSVWVKIPSIPSGGETVVYMYYGKSGETSVSNFSDTFTKNFDTAGLVARWHMDEGSGSSLDDSSANSNTGIISGASWLASDGLGWYDRSDAGFSSGCSLNFDSSGDYVSIPDNDSLDAAHITIEAWIKTGSNVSSPSPQYILAKWDSDGERSYAISIASSTVYFQTSYSGYDVSVNSLDGGTVSANTWYHIAVTSDGVDKKRIYLNGTKAGSETAWNYTIHPGTSIIAIGAKDGSPANLFKGIIDDVSIYNTALSAAEIEYHSKRAKYVNPPPVYTLGGEQVNREFYALYEDL